MSIEDSNDIEYSGFMKKVLEYLGLAEKTRNNVFGNLENLSFEDFFNKYCNYEQHVNVSFNEVDTNDINKHTLISVLKYDKEIYKHMCRLIFEDIKSGIIKPEGFNSLNSLDKEYILSKIEKLITQFIINPRGINNVEISGKIYDYYNCTPHEFLLQLAIKLAENSIEEDDEEDDDNKDSKPKNKRIDPNFFRTEFYIYTLSEYISNHFNLIDLDIFNGDNDFYELHVKFVEYYIKTLSEKIRSEIDKYNENFDIMVALLAIILFENLNENEIQKTLTKFSSKYLITRNYTDQQLYERGISAFNEAFKKDTSIVFDDKDFNFKNSKSEDSEYVGFLKNISKNTDSGKAGQIWPLFEHTINKRYRDSKIDEIESLCMPNNSARISSRADFCSQKISDLLFKQNSPIFKFDDFNIQIKELLASEGYTGLKYHISKKTLEDINTKFITNEKAFLSAHVNEFVKKNRYLLEHLEIADLFIFYKYYKSIFAGEIPSFNKKYKDFAINYVKEQLNALKAKQQKKGQQKTTQDSNSNDNNPETTKETPLNISKLLKGTSGSSFDFAKKSKELPEELIKDLDYYFNNIDPNFSGDKEEIIKKVKGIKTYYKKSWFATYQLKTDFFKILDKRYICTDNDDSTNKNTEEKSEESGENNPKTKAEESTNTDNSNPELKAIINLIEKTDNTNEKVDLYIKAFELFYDFEDKKRIKIQILESILYDIRILKGIESVIEKILKGQKEELKTTKNWKQRYFTFDVGYNTGYRIVLKDQSNTNRKKIVDFVDHDTYLIRVPTYYS